MGLISDIIEGVINGIYNIFKQRDKNINGWEKLHKNQVPNWVERAGHKFHNKHKVRHHDLRRHFKGDNYIYRIYFRKASHGRVIEELLCTKTQFCHKKSRLLSQLIILFCARPKYVTIFKCT